MKPFFFFAFLFICSLISFSQKENNIWHFGYNAGIDFNSGSPVALTGGQISSFECSSTVSDPSGKLLFYTDGVKVWNKNHVQMPNGSGLMSNNSSTQGALIVPKPGSNTLYYIFTVDPDTTKGVRYTEVDITLNGGLGDVTANKNILLWQYTTERCAGVMHCNNKDVWVITHDHFSTKYRSYLVTAAGVNTTPVVSSAGNYSGSDVSYLKVSPDRKKMAYMHTGTFFDILDFDNSTGIASNAFKVAGSYAGNYGTAFSADGKVLYVGLWGPNSFYQFNLCAGDSNAIKASATYIGNTGSGAATMGAFHLGADNKIYVAVNNAAFLGVINNPGVIGTGCNYVANGFSLGGKTSSHGLQNFISGYFKPYVTYAASSGNCMTMNFSVPSLTIASVSSCAATTNSLMAVSWNFGEPSSGVNNTSVLNNPSHTYSSLGTYSVSLILNSSCGSDTIIKFVLVNCVVPVTVNVSGGNICFGNCKTITAIAGGGTGPYSYLWSPGGASTSGITVCPSVTTTYTLFVTDNTGSAVMDTALIKINSSPLISISVTAVKCFGTSTGSAIGNISGGISPYIYQWGSGNSGSQISNLLSGTYTLVVGDSNGCTANGTATIPQPSALTVSLSSTGASCNQNTGSATASGSGGTPTYTYLWNTGSLQFAISNLQSAVYSVTITDVNGCTMTGNTTVTNLNGVNAQIISSASVTCNGASTGSVTAGGSGGLMPYSYYWSNGATQASVNNLQSTIYSVTITDAGGCSSSISITINEPSVLTLSITSVDASCGASTGSATAIVSGGTNPYSYSWNNGTTSSSIYNLTFNIYNFTVTDANNCTTTGSVIINGTSSPTITVTADVTILKGESTTISAYALCLTTCSYNWSPSIGLSCVTCANPVATPADNTNYCVTVTDANACSAIACVNVTVDQHCEEIFTPTAFSPNNDNSNDMFCVYGTNCIRTYLLAIYNRWGEKVFSSNDSKECWSAENKNKAMDVAVFYYMIEAVYNNKETYSRKGTISLLR